MEVKSGSSVVFSNIKTEYESGQLTLCTPRSIVHRYVHQFNTPHVSHFLVVDFIVYKRKRENYQKNPKLILFLSYLGPSSWIITDVKELLICVVLCQNQA